MPIYQIIQNIRYEPTLLLFGTLLPLVVTSYILETLYDILSDNEKGGKMA